MQARLLKRRDARRGVLLISRESLLGYLNELPPPDSATSPTAKAREAAAAAAQLDADCAEIDRRTDVPDLAKSEIKRDIRAGKLRPCDIARTEVSR